MLSKFACVFSVLVGYVFADLYMHNPRGSNNRYNGNNANVDNNNRLFDSQNNDKGGYCWGEPLYYYEGSELSIEWTNQHACGNDNTDCQIIAQYMCGKASDTTDRVRDGTTTSTIPDDEDQYNIENGQGQYTYGMHESYDFYQACKTRQRNQGLYIADQNINQQIATRTRQNPNGNRQGFECPEERDYYPYWAPTPWRDIAILTTNSMELCNMYRAESQNVMSKWSCVDSETGAQLNPITKSGCDGEPTGNWMETESWGLEAPDCIPAPWTRDNHLGNGLNGYAVVYNWTLPTRYDEECIEEENCICVLRLRYNMSTSDTDNWDETMEAGFIDAGMNGPEKSPLLQDPVVEFYGYDMVLALNTNQYGRTFQDRSHVFNILQRPIGFTLSDRIYNLNVRGKRGNIVQAYPAVEYDFVPTWLMLPEYAFVHFQWTGCDTNPAGNAGEGTEQTDRHNIVQVRGTNYNYPLSEVEIDDLPMAERMFKEQEDRLTFGFSNQNMDSCPTYEELKIEHNDNEDDIEEDVDNCMNMNAAARHFDGGLHQYGIGTLGQKYHYMSSRNNNFTNRTQKATLAIVTSIPGWGIAIIAAAGVVVVGGASLGGSYYAHSVQPHSPFAKLWSAFSNMRGGGL